MADHQGTVAGAVAVMLGCVVAVALWLWPDSAPDHDNVSELVAAEDHSGLRRVLSAGADPDAPIEDGLTPLMRAAIRDDVPALEILLDSGASVDAEGLGGLTPLHAAAMADAAAAVERLVASGADMSLESLDGKNALHDAARAGSLRALRTLLALGADVDARSNVIAQGHGHPRDVAPTALAIAARADQVHAVEVLLEYGADVNAASSRGITPLFTAVFAGASPDLVQALLNAGANPALRIGCDAGCSQTGELDALQWAVELDRQELVPLLGG